ncbi:cation diffusion facilitator family transporter [Leadbetterella sp. DM7]|uniref:cation diffusion facilitator family transporter n=1 Tax=Leadbetterella sp. DM7 TaxID=3235085 RepID=UPI00349E6337
MSGSALKTTRLSLLSNVLLAIIKWVTGVLGNSYALIADAIESTSDIFASLLVLLGIKYSSRPADKNHPYGHGRAEPLITFLVVVFLLVSAFVIAWQSINNIRVPHEAPHAFTLWVLGGIILWKELSYRWVMQNGIKSNSSSLKAEAWHHRADALTSVAAFTGISIALIMGKGYESADDWAALFSSVLIAYNAYRIFRPALGEIMDEQNYDELKIEIRCVSAGVTGVEDTEKLYIRKVGMKYHVDLHAMVKGTLTVKEGHDIAHRLKDTLLEKIPSIENVLIHIEPDK